MNIKPRIKVRYIGEDDPLMLRRGKVYEAIIGDHGWYSIIDETHEEYAYHPRLFEIVGQDGDPMASKKDLRDFLNRYLGRPYHGRDGEHRVIPEDVEALVSFNQHVNIAQDVIDYGTEHPEAPFSDFLDFIKPGVYGMTEEELLEDD